MKTGRLILLAAVLSLATAAQARAPEPPAPFEGVSRSGVELQELAADLVSGACLAGPEHQAVVSGAEARGWPRLQQQPAMDAFSFVAASQRSLGDAFVSMAVLRGELQVRGKRVNWTQCVISTNSREAGYLSSGAQRAFGLEVERPIRPKAWAFQVSGGSRKPVAAAVADPPKTAAATVLRYPRGDSLLVLEYVEQNGMGAVFVHHYWAAS